MGEVVYPDFQTTEDVPVERVLEGAQHLETVVVVGLEDGGLYVASSQLDNTLDLLETALAMLRSLIDE